MSTPEKPAADDMFHGSFTEVDADGAAVEGGIVKEDTVLGDQFEDEESARRIGQSGQGSTMAFDAKKSFGKDYNVAGLLEYMLSWKLLLIFRIQANEHQPYGAC